MDRLDQQTITFDFEEASSEWRKNKKYIGNGYFAYMCDYIHSDGKQCKKYSTSRSIYCKRHMRRIKILIN
jgi:hypothetical protein